MGKSARLEPPTQSFPYRISRRLNCLSVPRRIIVETDEGPLYTPRGVRKSALRGKLTERLNDASFPFLWRLLLLKRMYSKQFSAERMERLNKILERAQTSFYTKLSRNVSFIKKPGSKEVSKKKKGWNETDWRKHMEYINQIAGPRKLPQEQEIERGPAKPLSELMPRILEMSHLPDFRMYKRDSQNIWYKDPIKVSPAAKTYVATPRVLELAKPRPIPNED